ncbi:NAD(P)/FAD-dependent oxidoreductase [Paracoccus nototheniae]|uniref:FAD-dependent oxidoreductase n=1 Tax=Paracoccus nototheniae TaxID=2489002 RepID=A0ABW4DVQ3_9RHOB|nr:FAD-dependent monooxygenase [Paracoccus nototheniae]
MRVLIIGGGLGGLCLAQGLRKAGTDVSVFERQASASENLAGYGIHINRHGQQALKACLTLEGWSRFVDLSTQAGTELHFRDEQLRRLATRDEAALSGKPASEVGLRGVGRIELREILLDGLTDAERPVVQWDKTFIHYEQLSGGGVRAYFADGSSAEGDLLVGADASHSKVRQQYLPDVHRLELGILAIAGRYVLDETRARALPRALTDGSLNNIVPAGPGWMFVAAWRSRSADVDGHRQAAQNYVMWAYVTPRSQLGLAPLDGGALALQEFVLRRIQDWSPDLTTLVRDADLETVAPVLLRSMPELEPWPPSNVTLIGDAIHNMTPMAGIGANTALRDARILCDALVEAKASNGPLVLAVGVYETQMREYANKAVGLSRRNAENASSDAPFPRRMFRLVLRLAQAFPPVMRATLGRSSREP